ncbi:MAG TPA: pyridoxamine 5'-phosphate oxidase family protein, partial [Methanobacterium sp.]|nr:pyridoxamine 5'-phosphate oxidase family protein [Methanobacterium sp.]
PCHYGMKYYSIIGWGRVNFIESHTKKIEALDIIMEKYASNRIFQYDKALVDEISIISVKIDELTGKISGY